MKDQKLAANILNNIKSDKEQTLVVTNQFSKLIVEAPAGFGKTYSMINMIKYWFATDQIKNYQRVLCLSFSVSAANRMKESIENSVNNSDSSAMLIHYVHATNFHGLCRSILSKYGSLVGLNVPVNDYKNIDLSKTDILPPIEKDFVKNFDDKIKDATISDEGLMKGIEKYNSIARKYLLPNMLLPFNNLITLVLELLEDHPQIKKFYKYYYSAICIDEFQDTNILGLSLINHLSTDKTRIIAFGDNMQQIYHFLGAIPSLIDKELELGFEYIRLKTNYRFSNNLDMRTIDTNLRSYEEDFEKANRLPIAHIKAIHESNVFKEATRLNEYINRYPDDKIAILVSQNSRTTRELLNSVKNNQPKIFNGLFKEDDDYVILFHNRASEFYQTRFSERTIHTQDIRSFITDFSKLIRKNEYKSSLLKLLYVFLQKTVKNFSPENRNEVILTTLASISLKQSINNIDSHVVISTIHGSKGLEWDRVILANFEQNEFPNYYGVKGIGNFDSSNKLQPNGVNDDEIRKLVNQFYVAFSRAKKEFLISYSDQHWELSSLVNSQISCIATLPFLTFQDKWS
ncbi:UvrD-helicase domain-containing protein [Pediococcus siamensis]|uniref:UvrD-helicase domain-containing protein n=1 Tax=Pediococcus siamensis TaxID=381829 RepID=UPI00399F6F56